MLHQACLDALCREAVIQLKGEEAQIVADTIQITLNDRCLYDEYYRHALYTLVKLAATGNILPASLFVSGVDIGTIRDPIHGGGFADIFVGRLGSMDVAVKKLRFYEGDREQLQKAFCREALVWRQLNHLNVLPFMGVDAETFASTDCLCMVSPWMVNGTLASFATSDRYAPEQNCEQLLRGIASGLVYLRSQKVIHGDLHAANVFVSGEGNALLADFGLAVVGNVTIGHLSSMGGGGGHQRYMAPELSDSDSRRTSAADAYSFACICIFLYTRHQLFPDKPTNTSVLLHIINGGRQTRPTRDQCQPTLEDATWGTIERCWAQDPSERPSIRHVEEELRLASSLSSLGEDTSSPSTPYRSLPESPSFHGASRVAPTVSAISEHVEVEPHTPVIARLPEESLGFKVGGTKPPPRLEVDSLIPTAAVNQASTPLVQIPLRGFPLFRAKAVRDHLAPGQARSISMGTELSFQKHEVLVVTGVEDGVWNVQRLNGDEGNVLPIYLEPEVLFRANKDDVFPVDVLGVHNVWRFIKSGEVIERVHSSRMSLDLVALELNTLKTIYHSYKPEVQLQRHLAVEKHDEVVTQSEHASDWTAAQISRRHRKPLTPVPTEIGVIPTWLLFRNGQTGTPRPLSNAIQFLH